MKKKELTPMQEIEKKWKIIIISTISGTVLFMAIWYILRLLGR